MELDSESSDDIADLQETPREIKIDIKRVNQKRGAVPAVIPKILIDKSSYQSMLAKQASLSAREMRPCTPEEIESQLLETR